MKIGDIGKIVAQKGNKCNPIQLVREDLADILAGRSD